MKYWFVLALALVACSSAPTTEDQGSMQAPPLAEEAAATPAEGTSTESLATPVEKTPFDNLAETTSTSEAAAPLVPDTNNSTAETSAPPADPTPVAKANPPGSDELDGLLKQETETPVNNKHATVEATKPLEVEAIQPRAKSEPMSYNYKDAVERANKTYAERSESILMDHEGGRWEVALDFNNSAFAGFDYDPTDTKKLNDAMGGTFGLTYFAYNGTMGKFGIGLNAGLYFTKYEFSTVSNGVTTTDTNKVRSFQSFGGRLAYQFNYWTNQLFVPHVFYGYDKISLRPYELAAANVNYASRKFSSAYYGAGLLVNLNAIESSASNTALVNTGVKKFYLAYSFMRRNDANLGNDSHLLGLRFEY